MSAHGPRLAGEGRHVDLQLDLHQQLAVGAHAIAGGQQHHVARHDVLGGDLGGCSPSASTLGPTRCSSRSAAALVSPRGALGADRLSELVALEDGHGAAGRHPP